MRKVYFLVTVMVVFILLECTVNKKIHTIALPVVDTTISPVVPPGETIGKMKLEDGFEIKLIAAEPLVSAPVAMNFDEKGRLWVLQMDGYMPDTAGNGEEQPVGKIVLLEDKNNDGVMDAGKLVIDSLVMPRALCLVENGILVAEPPNLWYYKLKIDKSVSKTRVDSKYTDGGNAEHSANGLYRALDNWIYNANSNKRYRKSGNKWLIEKTHWRGQWGISQDNLGRLYFNDNSTNLLGDFFSPGLGATNKNQRDVAGYSESVVPDNRVFPLRPTTGVNRGYIDGVLNDSLRLVNFTAACGPLVYRGGLFGDAYNDNAFVAEPSANLIKRNLLTLQGNITRGREAYEGREFLASVDERFRPVNLYDGPDGALYIVDMYRGIIQHKVYLTPYLKHEIGKRKLDKPLNCGRIYKVYPVGSKLKNVKFPGNPFKLVALLGNSNGYVRDKAQQLLVDGKATQVIPVLKSTIKSSKNTWQLIHSLWTLEGLGAVTRADVLPLLQNSLWPVRMQALAVLPTVINNQNYKTISGALSKVIATNDELAAPYIAFIATRIKAFDTLAALKLQTALAKKYPGNVFVTDAVISGLTDNEYSFKKEISALVPDTNAAIHKRLSRIITAIEDAKYSNDPVLLAKKYPRGAIMYQTICKTCHGDDGNGIASLAPPLNGSEIVNGSKDVLISILLKGLTGPVKVKGHLYQAPEIAGEMPGFADNKEYTDEDLVQVLNYVRRAWTNNGNTIINDNVKYLRDKLRSRQKSFTMDELNQPSSTN
ncbi:dehydrogenase [Mucilaginibacter limnophilus]|uniref:Dehydrogenase n=1 Tax=Mucilaginibacter limnophilus TaxID=1932778 RepID=A0A437MSS0_9SPHI|nr:c-type cytochrome [Mucilaginibacter limnophilus]RVU00689.1 dehydrogenase [Mucilaginibacter limnophilus]